MLDFKGVMKGKVGDYKKNGSHLRRGKYMYMYIYIYTYILTTLNHILFE